MNKFDEGDVALHLASGEPFVILKVLKKRWFRKRQKYIVRWYNSATKGYEGGRVYESELREKN